MDKSEPSKQNYVFVQRDVDDFSCIKLTNGKYKDIIYTYGHVKFASEPNEENRLPLKFTYDVQRNPNNIDTESEDFRIVIGDILVEVIEEQLKNNQLILRDGDKDI